jgi:chromosome segregation ATPase
MSKERIETLTHQRQEKEEAIKVAREKIQQLQAQSKLKEEQSTVLTQANSALLDKAPTYLRDLDRAYTVKAPATTNEESDTQFIQQQIAAIDKQELRYKTQCKVDASTKLRDLLNKIDLLLKQNPNDFPESEIEQLVN